MARLPTPGSDQGQWGQILNDYLSVTHTSDGSLKDNTITGPKLANDTIPAGKLTPTTQASLAKADTSVQSVNTVFPSSGNVTLTATDINAIPSAEKGQNNGVASLDGAGKLTTAQIPTIDGSLTTIQARRGTATSWTDTNPILAQGEIGYDTTNMITKVGDGSTTWSVLPALADTTSVVRPDDGRRVTDAVGEWWVSPLATQLVEPYPRVVFGGVDSTGKIIVAEFDQASRRTRRWQIAVAIKDDHCCPALWVKPGYRPVCAWTRHNADAMLRLKVGGRSGDLGAMVDAPEVTINVGANVSYSQIHHIKHLDTADTITLWILIRTGGSGESWNIQAVTVNQVTGAVAVGVFRPLTYTPGRQAYITSADAHTPEGQPQVIRMAMGYNPAQTVKNVYAFELNVETLALTSPNDESYSLDLSVTGALARDDQTETMPTPLLPTPATGNSRRLFYVRPGPDAYAVAHAEWATSAPDDAIYTVTGLNPTPEVKGGLNTGATGWAQAEDDASFDMADGWAVKIVARIATPPTGTAVSELSRRYTSSADSSFYFRLTSGRRMQIAVKKDATLEHFTTNDTVPGGWTDLVGYGYRITTTPSKQIIPMYSLDQGATWQDMEIITWTGSTLTASTAPFVAGTTNAAMRGVSLITQARLETLAGTLVAGFEDFSDDWAATDAVGRSWSLEGGASIVVTVPASATPLGTTYGVSGPRVGYTAAANYIAGVAFEDPSYDRALVVARSAGGTETVELHRPGATAETIMTQPTSEGRLIRPTVAMGGVGVANTLITDMELYSPTGFTDYLGDIRAAI